MISILVLIKHSCPRLWQLVETLNGRLFALHYPDFKPMASELLGSCVSTKFRFSIVSRCDLPDLEALYKSASPGYLRYFSPHAFDQATLSRLYANQSFLMMKAIDCESGRLAGYFFLRGFFIGKAFHGLFVDEKFSRQGLGSAMWRVSQQICEKCGINMCATISRDNQPSMRSAVNGTRVEVLEQLDNNFVYVKCLGYDKADF